MSKVSFAVAAVGALLFHTAVGFVVPNLQRSNSKGVQGALPAAKLPEQVVPGHAVPTGAMVYGVAVLATAAAGLLARSKRASKVMVRNYGGFKPVVGDRYQYTNDAGYLADGTPISQAGNNSLHAAPPSYMQAPAPPPPPPAPAPAPAPVAPPPPVVTAPPVVGSYTLTSQEALHGVSFSYSMQKDAYADLEFLNDVGYLPDGTPLNRAGNCINHPETIQPDPHTPGTPLPRANLHNSVGYLPDGTAMNAAGNALNHPERMQPDMHVVGSPLPKSVYCADVGYLVDGTDLACAGNNFAKFGMPVPAAPAATAAFVGTTPAQTAVRQPAGFAYAMQKDVYADFLFSNDVGYLPDGTPMNRAGNAVNHPENLQPDPHTDGSPLPRALFVNDVGYLPDGTPMNKAGNAVNHPERIPADPHAPGSALPASSYAADIGYLVDGTPMNAAGNNAVH